MYTKCVYHNCVNRSNEISMFRFPVNDPGRLILWIRNSGNIYLDSLSTAELSRRYVCAAHFLPTSIHKGPMRSRLIGPAIPVHFQSAADEDNNSVQQASNTENVHQEDLLSSPEVLKVKTPTKFYSKTASSTSVAEEPKSSSSSLISMPMLACDDLESPTTRLSRKCTFEGPKKRLSRKCLFEENIQDTPKTRQRNRIGSILIKKNKALRSKIDRLTRKKSKQTKPDDFRSEFSRTLVIMQQRKENNKKKWTKEEMNLCLSLFYKSPSTYKFLRRQGIVLAAPSTIRAWLAKSDCLPGVSSDIFERLEKKFENASINERACVVCFDEMSIMANLDYSKKFDFIEGFEDLGGDCRNNKIAKYALVFLVRALYGQWKLPVTYFLSHSNVKAETLQFLIKAVINKLFDHGLLPKVVVCDQATTNQNVYKKFGVSTQSPFFFCNERKIFALFDVPHLVKSIRNNFLTNDYINGEEQMSFQDVKETYAIDKTSNISRTLTKLTEKHLNPNAFQKMNVRLATQIFSSSVAAAIKTVKNTGQLESETAEATAKFVQTVNNVFDALNSKKQFDRNPFKNALSKKSTFALNAINEAKTLFEKMHKITFKNKDGQRKKILTRPPCFDGLIQTCEGVTQLLCEELSDPKIKYLITGKLNQDPIENLFAQFRQKGGFNRNPTAKLLRTIFRSSLVNSLIKLPHTKNCIDEEGHFIDLSDIASSGPHHPTKDVQSSDVEPIAGPSCDKNRAPLSSQMQSSESLIEEKNEITLEECSLVYFAGYLAKVTIDKFSCQLCKTYLTKEINIADKSQILILNKSYDCNKTIKLKMPSDDLLEIIRNCINCYNSHFESISHKRKLKTCLINIIEKYLECEVPELLNGCKNHLIFLINHMVQVKINFYCKNKKMNIVKNNPKIRILKNT